jgi:hypothetical protein
MGRTAHTSGSATADNPAVTLREKIQALLVAEDPALAHLEETLTEGYAEALVLETERLRLERRLGDLRNLLGALNQRARALRATS